MIRENRYFVLRLKDVNNALTDEQKIALTEIGQAVDDYRERIGKDPMSSVVVEENWPMYEEVWGMIEDWVDSIDLDSFPIDTTPSSEQ